MPINLLLSLPLPFSRCTATRSIGIYTSAIRDSESSPRLYVVRVRQPSKRNKRRHFDPTFFIASIAYRRQAFLRDWLEVMCAKVENSVK